MFVLTDIFYSAVAVGTINGLNSDSTLLSLNELPINKTFISEDEYYFN